VTLLTKASLEEAAQYRAEVLAGEHYEVVSSQIPGPPGSPDRWVARAVYRTGRQAAAMGGSGENKINAYNMLIEILARRDWRLTTDGVASILGVSGRLVRQWALTSRLPSELKPPPGKAKPQHYYDPEHVWQFAQIRRTPGANA
jgi:hypothetical protein|tara:strand:- start:1957 stop:2388 length:432 start_codon:yes stop_codon:yes gene_type:complete